MKVKSSDSIKFNIPARPLKVILGVILSIVFVVGLLLSGVISRSDDMDMPPEIAVLLVPPVSAAEMEAEFLCPCCGKPVADCTCGMAQERKEFIGNELVLGRNMLELYQDYASTYSYDEFQDQGLVDTLKEYAVLTAPEDRPIIGIENDRIDAGELIQADYKEGERYELEFTLSNTGSEDLIINGLDTSCMCTRAMVITEAVSSPEVGMNHGEQEEPFEVTVEPGAQATLKVYYDPNAHGEFQGDITRNVTIKSNDPINSKVKVTFDLKQI
ncbi:MAG: DUF1573 domain-containing protein [Candidatus Dojkabacteria bacterium]